MIIRITGSVGTKRVEAEGSDSLSNLYKKVREAFQKDSTTEFELFKDRANSQKISSTSKVTIASQGFSHGDMIFAKFIESSSPPETHSAVTSSKLNGAASSFSSLSSSGNEPNRKDSTSKTPANSSALLNQIDEVDLILAKQDGKIHRQRNAQYCKHGENSKCVHCLPIEPYDDNYLEHCDPPIKYMSFNAYLRKLHGGNDKGKFAQLEPIQCSIKTQCSTHAPWPAGICTKCQPAAITLSRQSYRHVDNVMFENAALMDDFLDFWRRSGGKQRVGILMGRYETFDQAPLGIRAVVSAIYEPRQNSTTKSVQLLGLIEQQQQQEQQSAKSGNTETADEARRSIVPDHVMRVASHCGIRPIGWIFTDLVATKQSSTPSSSSNQPQKVVKHFRGSADTFVLSAIECITAAHLQNLFPNVVILGEGGAAATAAVVSSNGQSSSSTMLSFSSTANLQEFGSKFVTVVVTGDDKHEIHFESYQVSNQCQALVRDKCLLPTRDAPELAYVKESTASQYVPDVFYSMKDKYENNITRLGRPLPVEFLLVDMRALFPLEQQFTFGYRRAGKKAQTIRRYPIENRQEIDEIQDEKSSLTSYYAQFKGDADCADLMSNFHLLVHLADPENAPQKGRIWELWVKEGWLSVQPILQDCFKSKGMGSETTASISTSGKGPATTATYASAASLGDEKQPDSDASFWPCSRCTLHNPIDVRICQVCNHPKDDI